MVKTVRIEKDPLSLNKGKPLLHKWIYVMMTNLFENNYIDRRGEIYFTLRVS
jgi:hypothetical protein